MTAIMPTVAPVDIAFFFRRAADNSNKLPTQHCANNALSFFGEAE